MSLEGLRVRDDGRRQERSFRVERAPFAAFRRSSRLLALSGCLRYIPSSIRSTSAGGSGDSDGKRRGGWLLARKWSLIDCRAQYLGVGEAFKSAIGDSGFGTGEAGRLGEVR